MLLTIMRTQNKERKVVKYFGMKVTIEERNKIHTLARAKKKSAKAMIMMLIDTELPNINKQSKKSITIDELIRLPREEQRKIVEKHAKLAAKDYEAIEDGFDIIDY